MIKLLSCTNKKEDLETWVNKLLTEDTKYNDFIKLKEYYKNDRKGT